MNDTTPGPSDDIAAADSTLDPSANVRYPEPRTRRTREANVESSMDRQPGTSGKSFHGMPGSARLLNDRIALELFAQHGSLSRTQLRDMMGVTQPTAIDLVRRLTEAGMLTKLKQEVQSRRGPKTAVFGLASGEHFIAAVNVRDRFIGVLIADITGGPSVASADRRIDDRPLARQIHAAVEALLLSVGLGWERVVQTIVGVPGVVNLATGDLGFSWDLRNLSGSLLSSLQAVVSSPVQLVNGVDLAAVAEGTRADLQQRSIFALLWIGTGVGSCLMVNGTPLRGASGAAGQIGYTPVPEAPMPQVRPRTGGFQGDLQALIGGQGLRALAKKVGLPSQSVPTLLRQGAGPADHLFQVYFNEVARRIAIACASMASVVDPGVFVLQGSTAMAGGAELAQRVQDRFTEISPLSATVRPGAYQEHAELEGGIELGRKLARDAIWGGGEVLRQRRSNSAQPFIVP
ncbi:MULTISPECIES: ROK family transcriptional regulator [unclassified Microbacterium]|uniref:ROK family transcriptional regulator n=1 Tax=unclassified Microbacterium TaxID=2609290 RepID=UPI0012FB551C|nr:MULTISPECIES: ROK family transcriptional regulator [unclassified Microbacterium]